MSGLTHIAPSDLALIARAQGAAAQAQDRLQFVGSHITEVYGLGEKDSFNLSTGEINRAEADPTLQ